MAARQPVQIEICIDSIQSALAAEKGGAHRVELCQNLFEGGTTPSAGLILGVRRAVRLPVYVIIRPRGADFCYSEAEFEVMKEDVRLAREWGADGLVLGLLKRDGTVDIKRTQTLMRLAGPLPITFHRAFDVTPDPFKALEALIQLGVRRVLTSGQERTVLEGIDLIAELVRRAGQRIVIMPGGGISDRNFDKIRKLSKAREFHLSASGPVASSMTYRNARVPMGRELRASEFAWSATDPEKVQKVVRSAT
jgi:copper homeostasis protein